MASSYDLKIESPNVRYTADAIEADYVYETVKCIKDDETKKIIVSK